ncbi:MAG: hypothetical protein M0Q26_08340 [Chitinophagaceae bacterium]|nr:hypothetical protein [Chitinophagaceae bacterium]
MLMFTRKIQYLIFTLFLSNSYANDSLVITRLLNRVNQLQSKESSVFPRGIFPSYRLYALNKNREKADINIFFTGLISFTLQDIKPRLAGEQQKLADQIISRSLPVYQKFQNQKGRHTYNFWPTDTPKIFPNSGWMNLFDKTQALPDDLDDTVIMLLAMNAPDAVAKQVHALMQQFTNKGEKPVRNTFKDFRSIGAYSTWFGKKMPVDFDICVLANVLYFVQRYNLPWTAADSASLRLIEKVLIEKKHVTDAPYVSPHYSRLPILLYHIARLMSVRPIRSLEKLKPQLIAEASNALAKGNGFMDDVILSTSLLRWGVQPAGIKSYKADSLQELIEEGSFSFFIANMASMLPDPLKQWMGGAGVGKFYYDCVAYNNMLVLEYLALNK